MLPTTRKEKSITSRVDCYGDFSGYYYKEKLDGRDTKCFCLNIVLSEKIIATTDISLVKEYNLPEPSQSFIQKYIEEYNKGNTITDVLVEYEFDNEGHTDNPGWHNQKLKVNSKDNTITIKKVKDSWNKEEVIKLLFKCKDFLQRYNKESISFDKWVKENL